MKEKIASINWQNIAETMHEKGFAIIPKFLSGEQCTELINGYNNPNVYKKNIFWESFFTMLLVRNDKAS